MKQMRHFAMVIALLMAAVVRAETLSIDASAPIAGPITGHLKMGGTSPNGTQINADSYSLLMGGKRWTPVMGEFHFTRYPHQQWEEELLKMKAGGITLVSAYVFWIHHEEQPGQWDWTGDRDLRAFVELCAKHHLYVWVRMGPWCHGEVRNGGLPDWVIKSVKKPRTTDPDFMSLVKPWYQQIEQQLHGLLWKDGGPIVGAQLDNETGNAPYLLALKHLAREVGIDVPLYSVTGWNGAHFPADEVLPLFGGYPDGFWEGGDTYSKSDLKHYFFTHTRDDSSIGADLMPRAERAALVSEHDRYPFMTCECGGGMAIAYARRPLIQPDDVAALSYVKIGSGSNLPGYYMYQGGRNPVGKLSTMHETQAIGYPNDLPVFNYDFQAPLGEYGQVRESFHALRILHLFLADFGADMAAMPSILPSSTAKNLNDTETIRWAVRSDGHRAFVVVNNYQRKTTMPARRGVQFSVKLANETVTLPKAPIDYPANSYSIWPINMDLNGITLKYATAQPLCRIDGTEPLYVFIALDGVAPEFAFDTSANLSIADKSGTPVDTDGVLQTDAGTDALYTVRDAAKKHKAKLLVLTKKQATGAYVAESAGQRRLILSPDAVPLVDESGLRVQSKHPHASLWIYPPVPGARIDGIFSNHELSVAPKSIQVQLKLIQPAGPAREIGKGVKNKPLPPEDADFAQAGVWQVTLPADAMEGVHDVRLNVDYTGDVARAFVGDQFVDDHFYYGQPWQIGLSRFAPDVLQKGLTLKILPISKDLPVYIDEDHRPVFGDQSQLLDLRGVSAEPVYEMSLKL
jgi:hypothetical protein